MKQVFTPSSRRNSRAEYGVLYGVANKITFLVDLVNSAEDADPVLACYFLDLTFFFINF